MEYQVVAHLYSLEKKKMKTVGWRRHQDSNAVPSHTWGGRSTISPPLRFWESTCRFRKVAHHNHLLPPDHRSPLFPILSALLAARIESLLIAWWGPISHEPFLCTFFITRLQNCHVMLLVFFLSLCVLGSYVGLQSGWAVFIALQKKKVSC